MQSRYFYEAMSALNSWTKAEKEDPLERWKETVDRYKYKLHIHVVSSVNAEKGSEEKPSSKEVSENV